MLKDFIMMVLNTNFIVRFIIIHIVNLFHIVTVDLSEFTIYFSVENISRSQVYDITFTFMLKIYQGVESMILHFHFYGFSDMHILILFSFEFIIVCNYC
jgi:hypothetical protein